MTVTSRRTRRVFASMCPSTQSKLPTRRKVWLQFIYVVHSLDGYLSTRLTAIRQTSSMAAANQRPAIQATWQSILASDPPTRMLRANWEGQLGRSSWSLEAQHPVPFSPLVSGNGGMRGHNSSLHLLAHPSPHLAERSKVRLC